MSVYGVCAWRKHVFSILSILPRRVQKEKRKGNPLHWFTHDIYKHPEHGEKLLATAHCRGGRTGPADPAATRPILAAKWHACAHTHFYPALPSLYNRLRSYTWVYVEQFLYVAAHLSKHTQTNSLSVEHLLACTMYTVEYIWLEHHWDRPFLSKLTSIALWCSIPM